MSKTSKQKYSLLQRLWRNSQTKALAYVQATSAAVLGTATSLSSVLSSSEFSNVLSTLSVPWWVPTGIAVLALVTFLAHGHGD